MAARAADVTLNESILRQRRAARRGPHRSILNVAECRTGFKRLWRCHGSNTQNSGHPCSWHQNQEGAFKSLVAVGRKGILLLRSFSIPSRKRILADCSCSERRCAEIGEGHLQKNIGYHLKEGSSASLVLFDAPQLLSRINWCLLVLTNVCVLSFFYVWDAVGAEAVRVFPSRPVRLVTGSPAGGGDLAARLVAPGLSELLGQPVIVDNRGGANGAIAAEIVVNAPPDGHTIFVYTSSIWVLPFLHKGLKWDPMRDFSPVILMVSSPNVVLVHPALPVNTIGELIAYARVRPGELNFGASAGSSSHLAGELFNAMADIRLVHIPYKGSGPALNDLLGGQTQIMFAVTPAAMPHVRSGRLRLLAIASSRSSTLLPGVPTVATTVPGYESVTMVAMLAPARTPMEIVNRLHRETEKILQLSTVAPKFLAIGAEVVAGAPAALTLAMRLEMARMGKIITDAGIREE